MKEKDKNTDSEVKKKELNSLIHTNYYMTRRPGGRPLVRLRHVRDVLPEADRRTFNRVVAGESIPKGAGWSKRRVYSFSFIVNKGPVGTHGTLDYQLMPATELLNDDLAIPAIRDKTTRKRLWSLMSSNELVCHITGREVPKRHRTKPNKPPKEKINIGKRLWGKAVREAKRARAKFVFATTDNPAALKSQQDMGMQILYQKGEVYTLGMFLE